jgi:hypothetical protein
LLTFAAASTNFMVAYATSVAFDDGVAAERREAALVRRLGLVVAQIAPEEMHQLQVPHAASVHLDDALQLAFHELAALDGLHDRRRPVPVRRFEVSGVQHTAQSLVPDQVVEPREPPLGVAPELAGLRLTDGADAVVGLALDHRTVGRVLQAHGRHAPGTNTLRQVVGGLGTPAGAGGVRVHVDGNGAVDQRRTFRVGQHLRAGLPRGAGAQQGSGPAGQREEPEPTEAPQRVAAGESGGDSGSRDRPVAPEVSGH